MESVFFLVSICEGKNCTFREPGANVWELVVRGNNLSAGIRTNPGLFSPTLFTLPYYCQRAPEGERQCSALVPKLDDDCSLCIVGFFRTDVFDPVLPVGAEVVEP